MSEEIKSSVVTDGLLYYTTVCKLIVNFSILCTLWTFTNIWSYPTIEKEAICDRCMRNIYE